MVTLKAASTQGEFHLLYASRVVEGVETDAVRGRYSPQGVLERMLEGTPVVAVLDSQTQAFIIKARPDGSKSQGPESNTSKLTTNSHSQSMTKFSNRLSLLNKTLTPMLAAAAMSPVFAQENAEEEVFTLSPFTIDASSDQGYRATSTLAGTRLKTDLKDVGAAIEVLTEEFMEDIGATSVEDALMYTTNGEVGGVHGNFTNPTIDDGRPSDLSSMTNPQSNTRIRGLSGASLSRDYFLTGIGSDGYNVERTVINRGPNSILFGVASPGGVVVSRLKKAGLHRDFGEISIRIGERGSSRSTFDFNQVLLEDRLAIRVAGLYDETQYKQRPAFERDKRLYGSFQGVLFENESSSFLGRAMISGRYETGSIGGTPPSVTPPVDSIRNWYEPTSSALFDELGYPLTDDRRANLDRSVPQALYDHIGRVTRTVPDHYLGDNEHIAHAIGFLVTFQESDATSPLLASGADGVQGIQRFRWNAGNSYEILPGVVPTQVWGVQGTDQLRSRGYMPGFVATTFQDTEVLDFENLLITGDTGRRDFDFDNVNITFEQTFFENKAGIELAYNEESTSQFVNLPFGEWRTQDVRVDVTQILPNGEPNPNVGRPFMVSLGIRDRDRYTDQDREAFRATAFYELDFRDRFADGIGSWLGRHAFTGMATASSADEEGRVLTNYLTSDNFDIASSVSNTQANVGNRSLARLVYLGESLLDVSSYDEVRLTETMGIDLPEAGDSYTVIYQDGGLNGAPMVGEVTLEEYTLSGSLRRQEFEAEAFSWQSHFFDGALVGLMGWRTDRLDDFEQVGQDRDSIGRYLDSNFVLQDEPTSSQEGDTFTWSLVGRFPEKLLFELPFQSDLRFHYNESENFAATGNRRDAYSALIGPATGETVEYGVSLDLLDNKFSIKLNWFETSNNDVSYSSSITNNMLSRPVALANRYLSAENDGILFSELVDLAPYYSSYDEVYDALINDILPESVQSALNSSNAGGTFTSEAISGLSGLTSFVAEGFEVQLVANPTRNWRISMNVAEQQTVQSDTLATTHEVWNSMVENFQAANLWDAYFSPANIALGGGGSISSAMDDQITVPLLAERTRDGTVRSEQRRWRLNFVNNYSFQEGPLKGLGLGGAIRWQDEVATGYPLYYNEDGQLVPDRSRPFMGPALTNVDAWVSYQKRLDLLDREVDWRIQLNVRNMNNGDPIPVISNPDGSVAVVRIANPTEVMLTNTFRF